MPRETARPWMEKVIVSPPGRPKAKCGPLGGQDATRSERTWGLSFAFPELVVDQGDDGVERFLLLVALGLDAHFTAQARGQHHDAHDALAVDAAVALGDPDVAGVAAGQ